MHLSKYILVTNKVADRYKSPLIVEVLVTIMVSSFI